MPGTFTPDQTTFSISLMANLGSGLTGSVDLLETTLAADISARLTQYRAELGTWSLVWGPAIFQERGSVRADNAMFVAQESETGRYVVAIAGTNPYSAFDWVIEDAFVFKQVPWSFGNPPPGLTPMLAAGTDRGLTILQQLRPGPVLPGNSATLQEFLAALPAGPVAVTTAGHSLGGALSPVVALWLSDTRAQWDPAGRVALSCLPSAGPTPGNQDFATYYAGSPLGSRTTRIHNDIDVVPHAWAPGDLVQIPALYQPDIPANVNVQTLVFLAGLISERGHYAQLNPGAPSLPGQVNTSIITSPDSFTNFVVQLSYQHVDAYAQLMGVGALSGALDHVREAAHLLGPQGSIAALETKVARRALMAARSGRLPS